VTDPSQVPTSTYRLQLRAEFGFAEAAAQADYLRDLGVSHIYLSPILAAAPGSAHGYDVVDHTSLSADAGGRPAFDALVARLHEHGLGAVADVVPNHMSLPAPAYLNEPLWELLRDGRDSRYAEWFDIDWEAGQDTILMPVLGEPLESVLASGQLVLDDKGGRSGDETVLRYYEHEFPVRAGTERMPLGELVARQWYRLADWKAADLNLNYRRFFDVKTLVAVRVERPEVFEATHRLLLELLGSGQLNGLRIDHPDGLADPREYLRMLSDSTGGAWVVVEKILEGYEHLPRDWPVAGTTGYDALKRVGGVFVDPTGSEPLLALLAVFTGRVITPEQVALEAKMQVGLRVQAAEVQRLVRLLMVTVEGLGLLGDPRPETLRRAVSALLVSMDRYRAYVYPGEPLSVEALAVVHQAADRARALIAASDHPALEVVRDLALDQHADRANATAEAARVEFVTRFQQTCGPIMAKGIEDTAFYRWFHLTALNEVGGNPGEFGMTPDDLHEFGHRQLSRWPGSMTTLTTHDTKRSEDTRAALTPISELPIEWAAWMKHALEFAAPHRPQQLDPATEYLLWQTLVGTWPITVDRLKTYALKAVREACVHTSWVDPDLEYEQAVHGFIDWALGEPAVGAHVQTWVERTAPHVRAVTLGQKLLQLVLPGVPDVYQGGELVERTLVDPDNRRPVDYAERRRRLAALDGGAAPTDLSDEKLLVTSRVLRLRRQHPDWFGAGSSYQPVATTSGHALAIARGQGGRQQVVAVVTRLHEGLTAGGGFAEHSLMLAEGRWHDVLGRADTYDGPAAVSLADLLARRPVALLVRED